jgi:UTP-glucose-1-phosphate uridylyltransferase
MKGVGSQGDGSVQLLCESADAQIMVLRYLKETYGLEGITLTVPASASVPRIILRHERRVRQAVIVAGANHSLVLNVALTCALGLSTRMFPASAVVKKEMFPCIDSDGVCKPVIQAIVESLVDAGIEVIVIVCQQRDVATLQGYFDMSILDSPHMVGRITLEMLAIAARIRAIGTRIRYAVQDEQLGFGHAVWCANTALDGVREAVEEPFLLCLGDHLYKSGPGSTRSCAAKLMDAFQQVGDVLRPMLGLKLMPMDQGSRSR